MTPTGLLCKCEIEKSDCKERNIRRRNCKQQNSAPPCLSLRPALPYPDERKPKQRIPHAASHNNPQDPPANGSFVSNVRINAISQDFGQKKAQPLPVGPWKFWERMPERPVPYAHYGALRQMRIRHGQLHKTHHFWRKNFLKRNQSFAGISRKSFPPHVFRNTYARQTKAGACPRMHRPPQIQSFKDQCAKNRLGPSLRSRK